MNIQDRFLYSIGGAENKADTKRNVIEIERIDTLLIG